MSDKALSAKERAFIEAARRELGAQTPRPAAGAAARAAAPERRPAPAAPGRRPAPAALSPIDAPTVLGWDHPAAQAPGAGEEKWARIAALMEQERREAGARRQRMRRNGYAMLGAAALVALIVLLRALIR